GETLRAESEDILRDLRQEDPEFSAAVELMFSRPPYEIPETAALPVALSNATHACGVATSLVGMSFWTDAAILGAAGIPSVLFGPGGAGLHSTEEYVIVQDVLACRDALAQLTLNFT